MNDLHSILRRSALSFLLPLFLYGQEHPNFNVSLQIDYSSADQLIELCEGRLHNIGGVADAKGSQLAAATSILLARREFPADIFRRELETLRDNFRSQDDIFGFAPTRAHLAEIKALLAEAKKQQLDRRVIATISQFFPQNARISAPLSVYIVAFGHENASAFVRRVIWQGNVPMFVGEGQGEPVIVVNLQRLIVGPSTQMQYIETLSTLAHEVFHAVFEVYQSNSAVWKEYNSRRGPLWSLAELVQNEGIAYHISFQQRTGNALPPPVFEGAKQGLRAMNDAMRELLSPDISSSRAHELLMNANLSGSFEKNYGAAAGLLMAFAIDTKLGRSALTETIERGVGDFFQKYDELTKQYDELPKISEEVRREVLK